VDFSWIFVDFRGFSWIFVDLSWIFVDLSWIWVDFRRFSSICVDFRRFASIFVDLRRCELRDWTREIFTGTWTGMWISFVTGFVGFGRFFVDFCGFGSAFDLGWFRVPSGLKTALSGVVNPELQFPFQKKLQKEQKKPKKLGQP
jgi:hypothetical protein